MNKQYLPLNIVYSTLSGLTKHIGGLGLRSNQLIEVSIRARSLNAIPKILSFFKVEFKLGQLTDLFATHYPYKSRNKRFELTYVFLSLFYNVRICLRINVAELKTVRSVTSVFKSANWLEREVYDLFGIIFNDHPDLRPILTDYGFVGNPLRKDFPLTGYVQVRYDYESKYVITEPLKLTQEFRNYSFSSPWKTSTDFPIKELTKRNPLLEAKLRTEAKKQKRLKEFLHAFRSAR